ncbi:hypothetical protein EPN42_04605 [bacterium]|nr:MAG: hypothetical protein EPN42_04605 [bacterium]
MTTWDRGLFDAAAERLALESGRPPSQERAQIISPDGIDERPLCLRRGWCVLADDGAHLPAPGAP